jgi:hemerythrin-like domain-containing protein
MNIYGELKKDHSKIKDLMEELLWLEEKSEDRHSLIEKIRDELIPHARAEEAVFYNSMRALDSANDIIMDSYEEHIAIEALLRSLQVRDKIDTDWRKTAQKLKDSVEEHLQEEETKIFNTARHLFTDNEAEMLGTAFVQMKQGVQKDGIVKNTFNLLMNLMPPRIAPLMKNHGFEPGAHL